MEIDVRGGSKMILDYFVARTNPVDDFLMSGRHEAPVSIIMSRLSEDCSLLASKCKPFMCLFPIPP